MFYELDKLIEKAFKYYLHGERDEIINHAVNKFKKKYPNLPTDELRKKFNTEADRIYAIVDRSILRDRIRRASRTFWFIAISAAIVIGLFALISPGSVSTIGIVAPFVAAAVNYVVSIVTIPISYNQRIKGAMDSVLVTYENTLPSLDLALVLNNEVVNRPNLDNVVIDIENNRVEPSIKFNNVIRIVSDLYIDENQNDVHIQMEEPVQSKVTYLTNHYYQLGHFKNKSEGMVVQSNKHNPEKRTRSYSDTDIPIRKQFSK